jgi:hypothetical protein
MFLGIALIALGFYLVVDVHPWAAMIWLDLVVIICVFLGYFSNTFLLGQSRQVFGRTIPSIGMRWTIVSWYSTLAILGIIFAHWLHLDFKFAILYQLALAFGVLLSSQIAQSANTHTVAIQRNEAQGLSSLDTIRNLFDVNSGRILALAGSMPAVAKDFAKLQEDLRFLSASSQSMALDYDAKILQESFALFQVLDLANSGTQNDQLHTGINRIKELVRQRKNIKQQGDYKEFMS